MIRNLLQRAWSDVFRLMRSYAYRVVSYFLPRLGAVFVQLVTLPFILHGLSVRDYGVFALASTVGNLVTLLSFPQITFGSKVALARGEDGQFIYSLIHRTRISLFLLVGSGLILVGISAQIGIRVATVVAVMLIGTLWTGIVVQAVTALWVAKEKFFSASMIELGRASIVNGGSAFIAWHERDLLMFALSRVTIDLFYSASVFIYAERRLRLWRAYKLGLFDRYATTFGIKMFWANCAVMGRTEGISIILATLLGIEPLAIFRIGYSNIYSRVQSQLSGLADLSYAKNSREVGPVSTPIRRRQYVYLAVVGTVVSLGTGAVALPYILYFLPPVYKPATYICLILLLALPFDIVYSYVNQLFLVKYDYQAVSVLLIAHFAVQLALLLALTVSFGVIGAAASVPASLVLALTLGIAMERARSNMQSAR